METSESEQQQQGSNVRMRSGVKKNSSEENTKLAEDNYEFIPPTEEDFKPPEFTMKELRECIPAHLFERSLIKSSAYLIANLIWYAGVLYLGTFIEPYVPTVLQFVVWPAYWALQCIAAGGIWVIGHECGHQAFSDYKIVNNSVGLVLHSFFLVPYHAWRISHSQHHTGTANMKRDSVFVPYRRTDLEKHSFLRLLLEESPVCTFIILVISLAIGWFAYLFTNFKSQSYERFACHWLPSSPIFKPHHRNQIYLSNAGVLTMVGILAYWVHVTSFWTMAKYYLIHYLLGNGMLVCVTLLQHTDVYVPHYSPNAWNFVRGALCTVDRSYGWFINHALHHIMDSHVVHHLFSTMPHYNAIKATPYIKAKLGKHYYYDQTPVCKALMRSVRHCAFVENEGDILFYKNKF